MSGPISAPQPSYRLVPSRFPPISTFDTVASAADLEAVMELEGWTNDRLAAERLARLPRSSWVYGRLNASVVMAAFLHAAPEGARFNGPDLGAWYAGATIATAVAEVSHHLRREAIARGLAAETRQYRTYMASLQGEYDDIRGQSERDRGLYDPRSYAASQVFGEGRRAAGVAGIVYDSLRLKGGTNVVAYRPQLVADVVQTDHFAVTISALAPTVAVRRLA